jgi:maltokinase
MEFTPGLARLVETWLPQQRWFGGKGRDLAGMEVQAVALLDATTIWVATVRYADGDVEQYQVPLVLHPQPMDNLEHVLLGTVGEGDGTQWVYDALHDKDVTPAWLIGIRDEYVSDRLQFHRVGEPDAIPVDVPSLAMAGEQSNTSLMYGDIAILKVFRKLQPGINPDVEVQGELTKLGAVHVPALLGHATATIGGEITSIAMLQEFMTTASDGWELAKTSVRDLMAEADLHAEEAGGDFAGEAERLGVAVAEVHRDLATAFGTDRMSADAWRARTELMRRKLDDALQVVPELGEVADGLSALYAGATSDGLDVQRIHGDLHLGQALRTVHRWVLIDFEGEPMADIGTRREMDSPLRDVAGMLRSFDYAGHHRVIEAPGSAPQLAYRADEWARRNRDAFCRGYAEAAGADPREHGAVLRAFEAEKAVYEAVYEARNRPTWVPIPLSSLRTLIQSKDDSP